MPNVVAHRRIAPCVAEIDQWQPGSQSRLLSTLAAYPRTQPFSILTLQSMIWPTTIYNVYIKNYQNMCHVGALWKTNFNPLGFTAQVPYLQRWGCAGDLSWSGIWSLPCCPMSTWHACNRLCTFAKSRYFIDCKTPVWRYVKIEQLWTFLLKSLEGK